LSPGERSTTGASSCGSSILTLFLGALFAGAVYWVHGDIEFDAPGRLMSPTAIAHGSVLFGCFFAVTHLII
jgi:hypothetical protein